MYTFGGKNTTVVSSRSILLDLCVDLWKFSVVKVALVTGSLVNDSSNQRLNSGFFFIHSILTI
jgi:hypothetical protein